MKFKYLVISIFLILSSQILICQNTFISPKISFAFKNDFTSHEISLDVMHQLHKKIEIGLILGIVNMKYNDHVWEKPAPSANEYKGVIGFKTNLFPFKDINSILNPYAGIKATILFSLPSLQGGNMVFFPGFYFPTTLKDYMLGIIAGTILNTPEIDFIIEIEYEYRSFTFEYDEYYTNEEFGYLSTIYHSENKIINSILIGFGIKIKL